MKIALVRHGQTDWNIQRRYQGWTGCDLNDVGRAQAADAAARLAEVGLEVQATWAWIASSSAQRAVQTAQILGEAMGITPGERVRDLIERGFGIAEGELIDRMRAEYPQRDYPGGETMDQVVARTMPALTAVARNHRLQDGIVVSHGTAIRLITRQVTGIDPGPGLPNGCIAVLDGDPGAWTMLVRPRTGSMAPKG